jgi:ABC-type uncharacterized transport system permease subunit
MPGLVNFNSKESACNKGGVVLLKMTAFSGAFFMPQFIAFHY